MRATSTEALGVARKRNHPGDSALTVFTARRVAGKLDAETSPRYYRLNVGRRDTDANHRHVPQLSHRPVMLPELTLRRVSWIIPLITRRRRRI